MNISEASQVYQQLSPEEQVLKNKLQCIRKKLRPAKKAIHQHLKDNNIPELTVGKTIFKMKTTKGVKFGKKAFLDAKSVPTQYKQKYIKENTCQTVSIKEEVRK